MYGMHRLHEEESVMGDVWTVDAKNDPKCDYHLHDEADELKVRISPLVIQKVLAMCLNHQKTEFLVYLLGPTEGGYMEEGVYHHNDGEITDHHTAVDIYVPEQEVSVGSVHMEGDENIPPNVIGALHKHPGSGKQNFSHTDDHNLNINHDISIVIPEDGSLFDWRGVVRHRPKCGCERFEEASIRFLVLTNDIVEASRDRVNERIYQRGNVVDVV